MDILRRAENSICIKLSRNQPMMLILEILMIFWKRYYPTVTLVRKKGQQKCLFIVFYNEFFKNRVLRIEIILE